MDVKSAYLPLVLRHIYSVLLMTVCSIGSLAKKVFTAVVSSVVVVVVVVVVEERI